MKNSIINIAFSGMPHAINLDQKNHLILRIIEKKSKSTIRIINNYSRADLILAYPYASGSFLFKIKWLIFTIIRKTFKITDCTTGLRWILGVGSKPVIFVSHENLDRPYWWRVYGDLLFHSNLPRLTYWPKKIDAKGARFPYWYNYVDWKEYPRDNFYSRFGRLLSVEVLMSPLPRDAERKDEAVLIASHLDFPRKSILGNLSTTKPVAIFGGAGSQFKGGKLNLMRMYKYAFCCENSVGFGYDSEKIPEAWMAGCIPYGIFLNPFSDFNPQILCLNNINNNQDIYNVPLLLKKPNLLEIEDYIEQFINQYSIGNANL